LTGEPIPNEKIEGRLGSLSSPEFSGYSSRSSFGPWSVLAERKDSVLVSEEDEEMLELSLPGFESLRGSAFEFDDSEENCFEEPNTFGRRAEGKEMKR